MEFVRRRVLEEIVVYRRSFRNLERDFFSFWLNVELYMYAVSFCDVWYGVAGVGGREGKGDCDTV